MSTLSELRGEIISCERCPRLRTYCREVALKKRRQFQGWDYWGKPLPGFGDPKARLLVIGLAPAAHGGLRTGRMFCGDSSGDWLSRVLFETGFANQPTSTSADDGLKLSGAYVTAVVRCAPPDNRPNRMELERCLPYLRMELKLLEEVSVVLVLGRIAFEGYLEAIDYTVHGRTHSKLKFVHGALYDLGGGTPKVLVSYHPSRQNTQTGRLKWEQWAEIFRRARSLVG